MRANPSHPFAPGANRSTADPRLTLEALDADERARHVYLTVTEDVMPRLARTRRRHHWYSARRADNGGRVLTLLAGELVDLTNAGVPEAVLRRVQFFVTEIVDDCCCGNRRRSLDALDLEELPLEAAENTLFAERRIAGDVTAVDPAQLEEEAAVNRREAAIQLERAGVLEFTARRLRREREPAAARRGHDPRYPTRPAA